MARYVIYDSEHAPRLLDEPQEPVLRARQAAQKQEADQKREDVVRRRDAVVDAARTLDDLSPDGVRELVTRRWRGSRVLTDEDVESFAQDARKQRIDDVVDAIDHRIRRGMLGRRSDGARIDLPRGMVRSTLKTIGPDGVAAIVDRLRKRGWADKEIKRATKTYGRLLDQPVEGVAASEDWQAPRPDRAPKKNPSERSDEDLVAFAERIASSMPAPQVIVNVPSAKRRIVRDERGLITGVEDEP